MTRPWFGLAVATQASLRLFKCARGAARPHTRNAPVHAPRRPSGRSWIHWQGRCPDQQSGNNWPEASSDVAPITTGEDLLLFLCSQWHGAAGLADSSLAFESTKRFSTVAQPAQRTVAQSRSTANRPCWPACTRLAPLQQSKVNGHLFYQLEISRAPRWCPRCPGFFEQGRKALPPQSSSLRSSSFSRGTTLLALSYPAASCQLEWRPPSTMLSKASFQASSCSGYARTPPTIRSSVPLSFMRPAVLE